MNQAEYPFHVLVKPIGPVCNLDCDYCFYLKKKELYPAESSFRMTDDVLEELVRQYIGAQPPGTVEVSFGWQGGEPTLMGVDFYRRAIELQKKHARPGMRISNSLQTNGVLIDADWAEFLKKEQFLVGLSIDGPQELNDRFRKNMKGEGSFHEVMKGLDALKEQDVDFNTLTVIQSDSADHPEEVYDFLKGIGSTFLQFIPIVEPDGAGGLTEQTISPEQLGSFMSGLFDHWLDKNDVGRIFVQRFDALLGMAMGNPASICVLSPVCGRSVAMEHNGDVYSCDHYVDSDHLQGNIMKQSLVEMADGIRQAQFGRDKGDELPVKCRTCEFLKLCFGNCPKDRTLECEDGKLLNCLCEGYRQFYGHALPTLERMAVCVKAGRPAGDYRLVDENGQMAEPAHSASDAPGRNDPCPCGSGRKFKKCCMG